MRVGGEFTLSDLREIGPVLKAVGDPQGLLKSRVPEILLKSMRHKSDEVRRAAIESAQAIFGAQLPDGIVAGIQRLTKDQDESVAAIAREALQKAGRNQ
jgi:hypothetical protein